MIQMGRVVARNAAAGMAAQVAIKLLSFTFTVLVIRRLGVETYGQYAAVMAFGALFVSFADLGLSTYTVREVARLRDRDDGPPRVRNLLADVLLLRLLLATGAASLIMLTGWLTGRPSAMMLGLALGAVGLLIYGAQGAFEAVLAGSERLDWLAGAKVLQQLTFVLLGSVVLLMGLGYHSLILANLAGIGILTAVTVRGARRLGLRVGTPSLSHWLPLLRAALPFGVIALTLGLSYKFDTVLLNLFHGDEATGIYSAAYTLIFSVAAISNVINTALYPSLSRQSVRNAGALPAVYGRSLKLLMIIALPIAVGGWAVTPQLVGSLFGAQYSASAQVLRVIIWVIPFMFASEFLGYVVVISGHEKRVARAIIISSSANVLGNLLLIPRFGVPAAAVMTVVTEVVLVSQYVWMLRPELHAMHALGAVLRPLAAALTMGVVCLLLLPHLPLFATIALSALTYGAGLLLTGAIGASDWAGMRAIAGRPVAVANDQATAAPAD
jgi:O-antigen/teichoic acid export membrane protein